MSAKEKLSDFIKLKRTSVGITQRDLADVLGYETAQFVSNWERGISLPPIEKIVSMGRVLKVDKEELFSLILECHLEETRDSLLRKFRLKNKKI